MTHIKRRIVNALVAAAVGATSVVALAVPAEAANLGSALTRDEGMHVGDYIQRSTASGLVRLTLQGDGNLVLSLINANTGAQIKACWGAATNPLGNYAVYQADGNFVVYSGTFYDPNHPNGYRYALWGSNTYGLRGETVDINANGVLYVGYTAVTPACRL
ncbi:hypothetical protein ACPPVO_54400 [Dactylosporangium sp. McL0621]|uniref:hypothetical protein n=1 Tax=Dactylosporangium sp. McL0621 TaxID=3415678 RepID=UPI003CF9CDEF